MWDQLKSKLSSSHIQTDLGSYTVAKERIREKENSYAHLSDNQLKEVSKDLKNRRGVEDEESILIEAFALVSEVASRKLKMRPFDVQILGALALNEGKVIEMNTGEGKTLVATMPAYLQALSGKRVHVLTFNDYLAKRDALWMGKVYQFLGLSAGYVSGDMSPDEKRLAYEMDITYVTAKQAGFDYLRSFLIYEPSELIMPPTGFAIIDEVDSILIDEARTPLVIAGSLMKDHDLDLHEVASVINNLQEDVDFQMNQYQLNTFLTDKGIERIEQAFNVPNIYNTEYEELLFRVNQALHANCLLHKDIDYIVRDNRIELVDEFTGRVVDDRKWPHGLQAAIEAKENLPIQDEGAILGKTTLQHFVKRYPVISGMTGTAVPSAAEFSEMYDLAIVKIPPNKPSIRKDKADIIFPDKETKYIALLEEIRKEHNTGRPILVGTSSVEESEKISDLLSEHRINCKILNARNDEEEAGIVAQAGMLSAVTISTNMAGRGTDIKLGGEEGIGREGILKLGGLYVIGTNKFESRRIDNQLRGRSGRQGDPGESRFFISLEDDLLQRHGINELIPSRYRTSKDISSINSQIIVREVNRTQRIVEGKNLDIRNTLSKYASFVEIQRQIVHEMRLEELEGTSESLIKIREPDFYADLVSRVGQNTVHKVGRQVAMAVIDKNWMEYLEESDMVRQGIHLFTKAGMNPFYEFQRIMDASFSSLLERIEEEIIIVMKKVKISENGIDLEREGLNAPSATWTYLVSDNPFGDRLEIMLGGNIGFAAVAGLYWPLLALYFIVKRLFAGKEK